MDDFKYLPPKFSRSVKELTETLNIKIDSDVNLRNSLMGDLNSMGGQNNTKSKGLSAISSNSSLVNIHSIFINYLEQFTKN